MKKFLFLTILSLLISQIAFAKKVKFAVDMGTYTISPLGIHVMGDFQAVAGYTGGNFNPSSTQLTQEGSTTIYSIILDLPAFTKYEFKYVNGDQSYEAEFVPDQARVGYQFNDNRWIYLDSLQNDTTYHGAVLFSGNAPVGKTLIRFKVDMQNAGTISSNGVHVAGDFQGFDPSKIRLYSFENSVYEIITYMNTTGIKQFKYYNGNTAIQTETVPTNCATSGNRTTNVVNDSILVTVCYNECNICTPNGIQKNSIAYESVKLTPNPAKETVTISNANLKGGEKITIMDVAGKKVQEIYVDSQMPEIKINITELTSGLYQLYIGSESGIKHSKLIIE
ncbi:MAG: T9SS type A sorting domain-containing protein [Sphingobacteriaceae bacterium]|jgi:hypothetical protein